MDATNELLSISRKTDQVINRLISDLVRNYTDKLLFEDRTYIVPAVWGAVKNGELDATQKEIHQTVKKARDKVISGMGIEQFSSTQKFAVKYLINRSIISTITCLLEMGRSQMLGNITSREELIRNLETMGNA